MALHFLSEKHVYFINKTYRYQFLRDMLCQGYKATMKQLQNRFLLG